jgi:hypothetical protein
MERISGIIKNISNDNLEVSSTYSPVRRKLIAV